MKRLIINADDFGFTRGVNAGIVKAFADGILTSTTIMANGPAFEDAANLAQLHSRLAVGCHLAIVGGRPVAPASSVASLLDANGDMPRTLTQLVARLVRGTIRIADVEREFRAQVERVLAAGINPSHVDTHKHTQVWPAVMGALIKVAKTFGITRVRNPFEGIRNGLSVFTADRRRVYLKQRLTSMTVLPGIPIFRRIVKVNAMQAPDHFRGVSLTGILDSAAIRAIMLKLPDGTTELMCHPGFYDEDLECSQTRLKQERQQELEALTDPDLRSFARSRGIEFTSYADLG